MSLYTSCRNCDADLLGHGKSKGKSHVILPAAIRHVAETGHTVQLKTTAYYNNKTILISEEK